MRLSNSTRSLRYSFCNPRCTAPGKDRGEGGLRGTGARQKGRKKDDINPYTGFSRSLGSFAYYQAVTVTLNPKCETLEKALNRYRMDYSGFYIGYG